MKSEFLGYETLIIFDDYNTKNILLQNIDEVYDICKTLKNDDSTFEIEYQKQEATYFGIPTISLRSIWLIHDKYLVDNNLMFWTNNVDEAYKYFKENLGKKFDNKKYFCKGECNLEKIAKEINGDYN